MTSFSMTIDRAAQQLRQGKVIDYPTDTVYGPVPRSPEPLKYHAEGQGSRDLPGLRLTGLQLRTIKLNKAMLRLLTVITCLAPIVLHAATLDVPISLDYRIVEEALVQQVFTGPDRSTELFADAIRCNTLVLSNPRVSGGEAGTLLLITDLRSQLGTPIGGKCLFSRTWLGVVETEQIAKLDPEASVVSFQVVDSRLLSADNGKNVLPRFIQRHIRDYVHPRLGSTKINLGAAVTGIDDLIDMVLLEPVPETVKTEKALQVSDRSSVLSGVKLLPEILMVTLTLEVPDAPPDWTPAAAQPLADAELEVWDANWQAWDGFATWMIKTLSMPADTELSQTLAETLLEARYELRDALATDDRSGDPVRVLFLKTWSRLAPLLHDTDLPVPGGQALRFAGFISAGDALQALDRFAPYLGMAINQDALRSLARMLVPAASDDELGYKLDVDPDLRALMGLGPPLTIAPLQHVSTQSVTDRLLTWLIYNAHATKIDPALIKRLNTWIPSRPEIDNYLQTMSRLLDGISDSEHEKTKVPASFLKIYDPLLRATAWQESCWRQNVERDGVIEPIRSSSGSVGLMQINMNVWRGIYDIEQIQADVGYNALAGNEIMVHYLVDYAIRKNEHEVTGDADNLARATYAMYNGGPRHLKRYREARTSASLKKIDQAFWTKYQTIQQEGPLAVRSCLAGG